MSRCPETMLEVAVWACREAGRRIVDHDVVPGSVHVTEHAGVTTNHDHEADAGIRRAIAAAYPADQVLSEESAPSIAGIDFDRPLWIVDPVDGSSNRLSGHPSVGVSVAYSEHGRVVAGAVYAPFFDEMFSAVRGRGARCNATEIAVSGVTDLRRALVGSGLPHDRRDLDPALRRFRLLGEQALDIRRSGSPTLDICWVAMGQGVDAAEGKSPPRCRGCVASRVVGA